MVWTLAVTCAGFVSMKHPNLSKYNDDETYVYFFKEPKTSEETAVAQRALDVCPTLSIGNDG